MSILKIKELRKNYGKHEVLKGINLVIEEPGIYALVGPNGSGKSTFFNIISNLLKPTCGSVEILNKPNTDKDIFYYTSFLKDNKVLYEYLTGYDHMMFIKSIQKLSNQRVNEVIEKLGIKEYINKEVGKYSLGMKQHLLIAMAMLNNPKLMILDEPLNGLDPSSIINIRKLLKELSDEGAVIIISSHSLSEIDLLTDKIIFLKDGIIIEETISKSNSYKIILEKSSSNKINKLDLKDIDYTIQNDELIVNLKDKSISSILSNLIKENILFTDIAKVRIATEDRYKEIFPEEFNKEKV